MYISCDQYKINNNSTCKEISAQPAQDVQDSNRNLVSYNVVPNNWYYLLLRSNGKADTVAITILAELLFLHRLHKQTEFQLKFDYFMGKFNLGRTQIRDGIIRLEKLGLVKRELRTVIIYDRKFSNEMFLKLIIGSIDKLIDKHQRGRESGSKDNDSRSCVVSSLVKKNTKSADSKKGSKSIKTSKTNETSKISKAKETSKKETEFDESTYKSNLANKDLVLDVALKKSQSEVSNFSLLKSFFGKNLSSFHPLSKDDLSLLAIKSGREFNLKFVNLLMLRLSDKYPQHKFYNKKSVINYMAKVLKYEMRQSSMVNNEAFKFKEQSISAKQEEYLQSVEDNLSSDLASILRRKIAGVFSREVAYTILKDSSFHFGSGDEFIIVTSNKSNVSLSNYQSQILLDQIRSVYGNDVLSVKLVSEEAEVQMVSKVESAEIDSSHISSSSSIAENSSAWSRIKESLRSYFGEAIYQSWLSNLELQEDQDNKIINVKAPNSFIKNWVQNNYRTMIRVCCEQENYCLGEFV